MTSRRAPASMPFSTSSLTTEAGRSTTSPAAIWLARSTERRMIRVTIASFRTSQLLDAASLKLRSFEPRASNPALPPEQQQHDDRGDDHDADHPPELRAGAARKMRK